MIRNSLKSYYKIIIKLFFNLLYGNIKTFKLAERLIEKIRIKKTNFKTYKNKFYFLYKVKNARIYTDNNENVAIIKNNLILPKISFQQINGRLMSEKYNSVITKGTPTFVKKIKGKVFNLCQGASGKNYFHFLFDILPKIYLLSSEINLKEIDYFYVSEPEKYQIEIFKLLGIKEKKLLSSKKYNHIFANEIFSVDHPWYNDGFVQYNVRKLPSWIILKNRKTFLQNSFKKFRNGKENKLFLDRSQSKYNHCQISNFETINYLIVKKKIKIFQLEKISFLEQVNLLKNSSIVIAAHGAALANIIFCKPYTKIVEIIPSNHPNKQTKRICKILNLKYFRIKTKPTKPDINYPFKIFLEKKDLKILKKIISS
jgi:capsular polysaccharide biosynthesis protein